MGNMIPGATSVLGWGFNVFGDYSENSKLRQLLDFTKAGTRSQTVNGVDYEIPNGVEAGASHQFSGSATFLSGKQEITNYFKVKAGIKGGYAGFKGSLDVGFTSDELNSSNYNYSIYDGQKLAFPLTASNPNSSLLSDSVLNDADYQEMISAADSGFSPNNQASFYRFFLKYGTHFVRQVDMGGSLYYYAAVNKSFSSSSKEVDVKASAEYDGLFNVKATADVDWKKVGKEWVDNRQMKLVVVGGNVNFPTTSDAAFGTNMHEQYNLWITEVDKNPSPMGFKLETIDKLFSGKQGVAIAEALHSFIASELYVQVEKTGISMAINGRPVDTSAFRGVINDRGLTSKFFGYLALVIDRTNGQVIDQAEVQGPGYGEYLIMVDKGQLAPASTQVPEKLKKYSGDSRYMLAFMWYGENDTYVGHNFNSLNQKIFDIAPQPPLRSYLIAAGAGKTLGEWQNSQQQQHHTSNGGYVPVGYNVYIMVGVFGKQEQGFESMSTTSLTDKSPSAHMRLALTPQNVNGQVLFTPSAL